MGFQEFHSVWFLALVVSNAIIVTCGQSKRCKTHGLEKRGLETKGSQPGDWTAISQMSDCVLCRRAARANNPDGETGGSSADAHMVASFHTQHASGQDSLSRTDPISDDDLLRSKPHSGATAPSSRLRKLAPTRK